MTESVLCPTCGGAFEPRHHGGNPQKYCSRKCTRKAASKAHRDRNKPVRPTECAECGGPIVVLDVGAPRKFCSDKCKAAAGNRRARRALPALAQPQEKTCAYCGKAFVAKARDRMYCYDKWCNQSAYQQRRKSGVRRIGERTARCDGCGTEFETVRPEARWCSKACANKHWGNVRARQRRTYSTAMYTDREIFERDGWICQICHTPVNRDVARLHEDGATIDHVVPISKGGTDEPDNVVTAHWRCNRDKRAKLAT